MLLDHLLSKDPIAIKENALKVLGHSIKYHGKNGEFDEEIDINVNFSRSEIMVDIVSEDNTLHTNAFIFDDDLKEYYFLSKQTIITASNPELLGKVVELSLILQPYDENNLS